MANSVEKLLKFRTRTVFIFYLHSFTCTVTHRGHHTCPSCDGHGVHLALKDAVSVQEFQEAVGLRALSVLLAFALQFRDSHT